MQQQRNPLLPGWFYTLCIGNSNPERPPAKATSLRCTIRTLPRRCMQNSPRRFIRAGAVCFVRFDLPIKAPTLLGGRFAFDKSHHHARYLQAVVAVLQAVNARAVQVFTQALAAAVE
jgi:hypothetical protein